MPSNHPKLRELATRATGGEWRAGSVETFHVFVPCVYDDCLGPGRVLLRMNQSRSYEADAQYIAAASPMRVLELLDELERATAEVERLIAQLSDTRDG